jgi:hypothetical protein
MSRAWIAAASSVLGLFLRTAVTGSAMLIGRWTEQEFPAWNLA